MGVLFETKIFFRKPRFCQVFILIHGNLIKDKTREESIVGSRIFNCFGK